MISIEVMGGLGNQLFQIFALLSYCLENSRTFGLRKVAGSQAPFRARPVYWDTFFSRLTPFLHHNSCSVSHKDPNFRYTEIPKGLPDGSSLQGYFQSPKYFQHQYPVIDNLLGISERREEMRTRYPMTDWSKCISIHFRIGDYQQLQKQHPIMVPRYYENALKRVMPDEAHAQHGAGYTVIYYHEGPDRDQVDDIIAQLEPIYPYATWQRCDQSLNDWEQMLQMSLCRYNIIANSTFSWWAGYINYRGNDDSVVVYPETWFGNEMNKETADLFPQDRRWIEMIDH